MKRARRALWDEGDLILMVQAPHSSFAPGAAETPARETPTYDFG